MDFKKKYLAKQRDNRFVMEEPPFPKIVKIDICNMCNYACVFCPQAKQTGKQGNINDELCIKIIKDAYRAGADEICLSSTGEPLLNINLEKYIMTAKETGYKYIFFNTNGYLMDKERSESILASGVDSIKFSINAGSKETYKLVHGVDGYERVIENLIQLSKIRTEKQIDCKLYVSYVAIKPSLREVSALKNRIAAYVDDIIVMNANKRGGSIREMDERLYIGEDTYSYQYPCSQLFHNIYVSAEGYVNICCQDFENLAVVADLNEMDIAEAWNCREFVAFRQKYLQRNLANTLCINCIYGKEDKVIPLNKEKAYFKESNIKIENLKSRIDVLGDLAKSEEQSALNMRETV